MESLSSNNISSDQDTSPAHEVLTFVLGEHRFGVWPEDLLEIVEESMYIPVPNSPDFLTGIVNSHGRVVAVIDITKIIKSRSFQLTGTRRIAVLKDSDFMIGLLVPSLLMINLYSGEMEDLGAGSVDFFKKVKFATDDGEEVVDILVADSVYGYLKDYFKQLSIKSM